MDKTPAGPKPPIARNDGDFALVVRLMRDYVGRQKRTFIFALLCMLGGAAMGALLAYSFDPMVKYLFFEKRADMVILVPAGVMAIVIARGLFSYGEAVCMNSVGQNIVAATQREMAKSIMALDLAELNAAHSGQFISKFLYDATLLRDSVTKSIALCAKELVSLILFVALMIYQNWQLSLVLMLSLPIVAWIVSKLGRSARKASTRGMVETAGLSTAFAEMLGGRRIVRAYGLESHAIARVVASIDQRLRFVIRANLLSAVTSPTADIVNGAALSVIFVIAGYENMAGTIQLNSFASFLAAMLLAHPSVRNLSNLWVVTTSGLSAARRVFALIDTAPTIVDAPSAKPLKIAPPPFGGSVRFDNVCFGYQPDQPALDGVSFEVAPGKKIALVGPSGAGKSTIFNLLLRFYDPGSGTIAIDGQTLGSVTMASLRGALALVTQEPFLFDETVRANIGYGRKGASFEDIVAAAKAAAAHDFIEKLPQGYDTIVGEAGLRLSGGQRQRIAIARAMLRDAPILLLDEATSALDTENERHVQEALRRLMKGRTTIVIAHRLSTIVDADTIYVLDHGRLIESGSHGELIARGGLYARLYEDRFQEDGAVPIASLG